MTTTTVAALYGIRNCDTVKAARAWWLARGHDVPFHDVGRAGVPEDRLDAWVAAVGWECLLNRRGTTWRRLDEATRAAVVDGAAASRVMRAHPSVIRRPVVEWADGSISVGFDAAAWARR